MLDGSRQLLLGWVWGSCSRLPFVPRAKLWELFVLIGPCATKWLGLCCLPCWLAASPYCGRPLQKKCCFLGSKLWLCLGWEGLRTSECVVVHDKCLSCPYHAARFTFYMFLYICILGYIILFNSFFRVPLQGYCRYRLLKRPLIGLA